MELDVSSLGHLCSSSLIMHVNKVYRVTTIKRVAEDLGESEDWLFDVANEMDAEDGVIWVYGVGDDQLMAFTDFGIETLIELIAMQSRSDTAQTSRRSRIGNLRPTSDGYFESDIIKSASEPTFKAD